MSAYYNEHDKYAAQWLRNLIEAGHIAPGIVDDRSIVDVRPEDLDGFTQCHFFAGIAGWSLAARLAGWPDDRELWTGSCPCQPFSVAGKGDGDKDARHLWPDFFRLIAARRPAALMGEQVAAAVGKDWLDRVFSDLESVGYACGATVIPACAVNAPHRRDRLWFVAGSGLLDNGDNERLEGLAGDGAGATRWTQSDRPAATTCRGSNVCDPDESGACAQRTERSGQLCVVGGDSESGFGDVSDGDSGGRRERTDYAPTGHGQAVASGDRTNAWDAALWIIGHDGKARRVEPSIRLLAHGVSARVGKLRAYGNAIVPEEAAEVIAAYMECAPA